MKQYKNLKKRNRFKTLRLLILLFIIAVITGYYIYLLKIVPKNANSLDTSNWKSYTDSFGFSIKVPQNFLDKDTSDLDSKHYGFIKLSGSNKIYPFSIELSYASPQEKQCSSDKECADLLDFYDYRSLNPEPIQTNIVGRVIDGISAMSAAGDNSEPINYYYILAEYGKRFNINISIYRNDTKIMKGQDSIINAILATLTFSKNPGNVKLSSYPVKSIIWKRYIGKNNISVLLPQDYVGSGQTAVWNDPTNILYTSDSIDTTPINGKYGFSLSLSEDFDFIKCETTPECSGDLIKRYANNGYGETVFPIESIIGGQMLKGVEIRHPDNRDYGGFYVTDEYIFIVNQKRYDLVIDYNQESLQEIETKRPLMNTILQSIEF